MRFAFCILILTTVSCANKQEEQQKVYDLYEYSEMALYMHSIYDMHTELRENILNGNDLGEIPEEINKIKTADMSELFERTESFDAFSRLYIQQVSFIYDSISETPLKERYNNAVSACIACHQTTCLGPIPKIKKLLIN